MSKWIFLLIFLTTNSVSALTNQERKVIKSVREQIRAAALQYDQAINEAALADQRALEAETHAIATDQKSDELQKDIDAHFLNEQRLSSLVNKYEQFWKEGHKWFGLGAIFLGIGLLLKHFIIGIAILVVLGIVVAVFAPWVLPLIRSFFGMIAGAWRLIFNRRKS